MSHVLKSRSITWGLSTSDSLFHLPLVANFIRPYHCQKSNDFSYRTGKGIKAGIDQFQNLYVDFFNCILKKLCR
jgi:hypothetical protein